MMSDDLEYLVWTDVQLRHRVHSQGVHMATMRQQLDDVTGFNSKVKSMLTLIAGMVLANLGVSIMPILLKMLAGAMGAH